MQRSRAIIASLIAVSLSFVVTGCGPKKQSASAVAAAPIPEIVQKNGHFALMVDGAPFLMLGVQANNAGNYPSQLPKVWPAESKTGLAPSLFLASRGMRLISSGNYRKRVPSPSSVAPMRPR